MAAGGAYFQNSGRQVLVGNSQIELAFSATNGGLLNLVDKATGQDFIVQKNAYWNGFTFSYIAPGNSTLQYGNGAMAQSAAFTPTTTSTGIQVTIQFNKFVVNSSALNVSATLIVSVDNVSPLTTWQLSVSNQDRITIESVQLPYLTGLGQMSTDPAKDYLAYPSLSGTLFQDPVHNFILGRGWGGYYPSGYDDMQFLAYYSGESGAGLYIASQDTAGYTKHLDSAQSNNNWFELDCFYVPTFQAGASVTVPYPVVVGVFHGDWFDAASLYRVWAIQQPWTQGGPLATRTDVPEWYKNTGMMAYKQTLTAFADDYQSYSSLAPVAGAWQQQLQSPPLMNWISWENQGAWMDSPDFLPPSQGWAAFDSAVSATHAAGGRLMVMPTTNDATVGAPSWASLQATASQQADASMYLYQTTNYNQSYQPVPITNAQMDPTQPWHDALLSLTSQLQQHAIDLIHMDGNPGQVGICYATNHSHPPGGGNWWFQDYAQIYRDVRKAGRAVNPGFAMGGEFYAEPFLSLTDSGMDSTNTGLVASTFASGSVVDSTKVSFIPLWQAVYHDFTLTYSNLSFIDGHDLPYYRRGFAIPLVWGEIPMVFADSGYPPPWQLSGFNPSLLQYVQRIVSLRTTYGYPFVVLGRMLRPPAPAVPTYTVPPATQIPYTMANSPAFNVPSILSGAWQSPQGDAALIFTNISDSAVSFSWTVSAADVPLDSRERHNLYILTNGVCTSAQRAVHLPYTLSLNTNSTDVVMALFSSDTPGRPTYGAGPRPLSTTGLCADLDESRDLEQHKERPSDLVQAASALPKSR
jgi:hypothetical protein